MRQFFLVALLLSASTTFAQTTQQWAPGWDTLNEPLNFTKSSVTWWVPIGTPHHLVVSYHLVGATPNKLYQVGVHIFCSTFPATFGQFPSLWVGTCPPVTRQGVTATVTAAEMGAILTDIHGNGYKQIIVGPVASGTYNLEFHVRNGAGCDVSGGGRECAVAFQSPGPVFGTPTTIILP